jgi:hypothetical protein
MIRSIGLRIMVMSVVYRAVLKKARSLCPTIRAMVEATWEPALIPPSQK